MKPFDIHQALDYLQKSGYDPHTINKARNLLGELQNKSGRIPGRTRKLSENLYELKINALRITYIRTNYGIQIIDFQKKSSQKIPAHTMSNIKRKSTLVIVTAA